MGFNHCNSEGDEVMKNDDLKKAYQQYYASLYLYALSLTKNSQDASDLVAETFIKALLNFKQGQLKNWLFKVLKNEFFQWYKKRKRYVDEATFDLTQIIDIVDIPKDLNHQIQKEWLAQQISQLSSKYQEIMYLSYYLELKDEEIARITDLSIENVRVIRHRIKNDLIEKRKKEWQE